MSTHKIMVIRHAEKPDEDGGGLPGLMPDGTQNKEPLTARGWQRANALVGFFKPLGGVFPGAQTDLAVPKILFASAPSPADESLRPAQTITPLANAPPPLRINEDYSKGQEKELAKSAIASDDVVLIAWQHERIPDIAKHILGDEGVYPRKWCKDRFDLVWVFDRAPGTQTWALTQVPQMLLPGDSPDPIPLNCV